MTESLPRPLARYLLLEELASGGMAQVYLAQLAGPAGFSRLVAIKCLHAQFAGDPEFRAMLFDEARLVATIRHRNVVPILEVLADTDPVGLVMEYVHGVTLARLARLERGGGSFVPLPIVSSLVCDLLEGLHAAHEARSETGEHLGVVHRDVSPQNVMVDAEGFARVLDFGIAKAEGRSSITRDGRIKGKAGYMAPEQMRGGEVDRRTDVFAAGVVLWELLTGERYAGGDSPMAAMLRILEGGPKAPSTVRADLAADLDAIVLKALARSPGARFATAREMAEALEACLAPAKKRDVAESMKGLAAEELRTRSEQEESANQRATALGQSRVLTRRGVGRKTFAGVTLAAALLGGGVVALARRDAALPPVNPPAASTTTSEIAPPQPSTSSTTTSEIAPQPSMSAAPRARRTRPPPHCSPPYTIRSDGVHVPKPECF